MPQWCEVSVFPYFILFSELLLFWSRDFSAHFVKHFFPAVYIKEKFTFDAASIIVYKYLLKKQKLSANFLFFFFATVASSLFEVSCFVITARGHVRFKHKRSFVWPKLFGPVHYAANALTMQLMHHLFIHHFLQYT